MGQSFLSCDRGQEMLLPPNLVDWLPEGHLARFVVEVVERLDLSGIYGVYRADGSGRPAHDPAMMTALLLYNYAVGVRSSRVIERRCVEDVPCRVLAANRAPDHVTINRFRSRHQDALSRLFVQVLGLCSRAGMVKVGTVAIDSTKMAADASMGANRTIQGLEAEARRILEEAAQVDAAEDELYGQARGDELPEDLANPATRAGRIKQLLDEAQAEQDAAQAEQDARIQRREERKAKTGSYPPGPPPAAGPHARQAESLFTRPRNVTDPDSRIVVHRGMRLQGYNIQAAVADGQIILATHARGLGSDSGQLTPMLKAARENLKAASIDQDIDQVLADSGYWTSTEITTLQTQGLDMLVCPRPWKPGSKVTSTHPAAIAMADRLTSPDGANTYRRRQQIVEPVFAHIKHLRGITRLLRRGQRAVQAEIDLIATTHNLLKLYRAAPTPA